MEMAEIAVDASTNRFFAVKLKQKAAKEGDEAKAEAGSVDMKDVDEARSNAAQVWVVRFKDVQEGWKAGQTLLWLQSEGHLADLLEAEAGEDRAPRSSMVKLLEDALGKSTAGRAPK